MQQLSKIIFVLATIFFLCVDVAIAQCAICTKTASQLGAQAAQGLNYGILYLASTPLILGAFLGYRWWKKLKAKEELH